MIVTHATMPSVAICGLVGKQNEQLSLNHSMLSEYPAPQQPRSAPAVDRQLSVDDETDVSRYNGYSGWHSPSPPPPRRFCQWIYDKLRTQSGEGWRAAALICPPRSPHAHGDATVGRYSLSYGQVVF